MPTKNQDALAGDARQGVRRLFENNGGTDIDDEVVYELRLEPLGRLVHPLIRIQFERISRFREEQIVKLLSPA